MTKPALDLRNTIFGIINDTYTQQKGRTWSQARYGAIRNYGSELCLDVTTLVLAEIALVVADPAQTEEDAFHGDDLKSKITNILWMHYPGGGTAENCADKIMTEIGMS